MRVAIICEGSTDRAVLEAVIRALVHVEEMVPLHPDFDRLRRPPGSRWRLPTGWQAVRAFLRDFSPGLGAGQYDLVVIQVDASIRLLPEINKVLRQAQTVESPADGGEEPVASGRSRRPRRALAQVAELAPLCAHVQSWSPRGLRESAAVVLPREGTEAWLLAANSQVKNVESLHAPERRLAQKGLIGVRGGDPEKLAERYGELARPLVRLVKDSKSLRAVPELERFVGKVRERARRSGGRHAVQDGAG